MSDKKRVVIIGAGVGGLASACLFARAGFDVTVLEKHKQVGGRAGLLQVARQKSGEWLPMDNPGKKPTFRFDTGPSWLLMQDVFQHFYELMDEDIARQLDLIQLSPSYHVRFKDTLLGSTPIFGDLARDQATFDAIDPGSGQALARYADQASELYDLAYNEVLYRNTSSLREFINIKNLRKLHKLQLSKSLQQTVAKHFTQPQLQQIMSYQSLFLGCTPSTLPALYRLLSHVEYKEGVYYPMGGMYRLVESLESMAREHGAIIHTDHSVQRIASENGRASAVHTEKDTYPADIIISGAGWQITDQKLLNKDDQHYPARSWKKRRQAPSALLLYLGLDRKYNELQHHNLVFAQDWQPHMKQLAKNSRRFPKDPSYYVCCPSKTDPSAAPSGHENIFVMVPISNTVRYDEAKLAQFIDAVLGDMEHNLHLTDLKKHIVYQKHYCRDDFSRDFSSPKGSALSYAHTLSQSAFRRLPNQHPKLPNLLFVGADTAPGIGLPMCLISAELAYKRVINETSAQPLTKL